MSMDTYEGSSEQGRCVMVATNISAPSPRDLPPLQLKANLPLQQVELDQMQTDERSQRSEELSVDKDTLRPRARAPSPWHSTLAPRHESNTRVSGLRHDVFNRIGPLKLDHQAISPGSSALRSRNAPNPRKGVSRARPSNGDPSTRHCAGISRLALRPRRSVLRSLQRVSSLQAGSFRAGNIGYSGGMSEPGVAPTVAVDHLKPRTDLAPVIIVVAASTASNVSSVAFATCCSEVGAGGEMGSGKDGSGDCVMDTSDSGAGGSASGITDIRDTGNSGYSGGVSGASVAPAAAVDHFNPRTDLAPVIIVVAASTASNVSSVALAASAGANNNDSGWGDFEKPLDMLLEEELGEQPLNSRSRRSSQPSRALQPPQKFERLLQVVNMSEDDWEPDLDSEEEPPSDDESRGRSDGAGSSMGSDSSENEEDWQAGGVVQGPLGDLTITGSLRMPDVDTTNRSLNPDLWIRIF